MNKLPKHQTDPSDDTEDAPILRPRTAPRPIPDHDGKIVRRHVFRDKSARDDFDDMVNDMPV
ncbi:MAG: hypothetical protein AAGF88_07625 [Pseudomonadota bacterium]